MTDREIGWTLRQRRAEYKRALCDEIALMVDALEVGDVNTAMGQVGADLRLSPAERRKVVEQMVREMERRS